jgi:site-specific recombinase XerD
MLRSGASSPVISAVLGHADPTTTGTYMEMDAPHMRSCVLALPKGATACP